MSSQWNPRWRAFDGISIYWQKEKKRKEKKDSGTGTALTGTGTTLAKRDSSHSVPVPHLLVPVLLGVHGPI